jgi:myo-inositol-1(or 4)-monophosphatase
VREFLFELAGHVRRSALAIFGRRAHRYAGRASEAGDAQFDIDAVAERAVREFAKAHGRSVVLFTEDRGLYRIGAAPEHLLIVDPIDGSRGAAAGLETCCISIAAAPFGGDARLGDVQYALLVEVASGAWIYAERDGALESSGHREPLPNLSTLTDLDRMFWSIEFNGHPAELMTMAYGHLIDRSANPGGLFVWSSACYSISRIITGQIDAYVDIGNRLLRDHPRLMPRFLEAGRGHILHLFPYDLAAAVFLAEKAGVIITDAYGSSLADICLTDTSPENQRSCIAASTRELHRKLLAEIRWDIPGAQEMP